MSRTPNEGLIQFASQVNLAGSIKFADEIHYVLAKRKID